MKVKNLKIPLPSDKYISKIEVNKESIDIEFKKKKKIALLFISLNENYWPYLRDVVADCRTHFLPHHNVDYLVWSDMLDAPSGMTVFPTEPVGWPAPTLMRYHLFLQQEEKLKEYDYIFYLDSDMRVVDKISDEILGEGLTAAEHPMYSLRKEYIPPYEPNKKSAAYVPRLGQIIDDEGKPRFKPLYLAGGFQGGKTEHFIKAMKKMKRNVDIDFNNNYTAIWNDESHWNKYLYTYKGHLTVLSPSYIYPDSLIKEYYENIWGKSYIPKIITLTKPFTLSKEAGTQLNRLLGRSLSIIATSECPTCKNTFNVPGYSVVGIGLCTGSGKPHPLDLKKI